MTVLTSIISNNKINIWSKLKRAKQVMTHEILQSDALNNTNISSTLKQYKQTKSEGQYSDEKSIILSIREINDRPR